MVVVVYVGPVVEEELQQYKDWMKVQMDKFKQQLALAQAVCSPRPQADRYFLVGKR